jgi:L-2-hydroxyglutarate oxidase LhgO
VAGTLVQSAAQSLVLRTVPTRCSRRLSIHASTAAAIALETLKRCFAHRLVENDWLPRLKEVIPTYAIDLKTDADACRTTREKTARSLWIASIELSS